MQSYGFALIMIVAQHASSHCHGGNARDANSCGHSPAANPSKPPSSTHPIRALPRLLSGLVCHVAVAVRCERAVGEG
jgi:hypothetical protein